MANIVIPEEVVSLIKDTIKQAVREVLDEKFGPHVDLAQQEPKPEVEQVVVPTPESSVVVGVIPEMHPLTVKEQLSLKKRI